MKKVTLILAAILVFGVSNVVKAQGGDTDEASHSFTVEINATALVDIEGATSFSLTPNLNSEAGENPFDFTGVSNSTSYLNYTSVKDDDNATRSISAKLEYASTELPDGINIVLTPGTLVGNGKGDRGTVASSAIVLDQDASDGQTVVSGIGSCYTGNGTNAGVNLDYSLQVDENEFGSIEAGTYSATVTYTITDI